MKPGLLTRTSSSDVGYCTDATASGTDVTDALSVTSRCRHCTVGGPCPACRAATSMPSLIPPRSPGHRSARNDAPACANEMAMALPIPR